MQAVLLSRKAMRIFDNMGGNPALLVLNLSPLCHTLDTSLSTRQHWSLFPKLWAIFSMVIASAVSVPLFALKPYCAAGSKL